MTWGTVYWVTGLSGAGKTTVSRLLFSRLREASAAVVLLDGDALREVFGADLGHGLEERREAAFRYGRLCRMLAGQSLDVVCATISMFHDVRAWNRANIPNYREIYLRVPLEVLAARDPKGIYRAARAGAGGDVVGLDIPAEEPASPDLVIDNHGAMDPSAALERIVRSFAPA